MLIMNTSVQQLGKVTKENNLLKEEIYRLKNPKKLWVRIKNVIKRSK